MKLPPSDIPSFEITPEKTYLNRRAFMALAASTGAALAVGAGIRKWTRPPAPELSLPAIPGLVKSLLSTTENPTSLQDITHYNNFYEFGTGKYEPAELARNFKTDGWKVAVEGLVQKPVVFDLDAIRRMQPLEERIYRHRCVEGWSMVIPWAGFSLSEFIKRAGPLGAAKFVQFETLHDPAQMPGQNRGVLPWPYVEGLRMDEAMHPLALLCLGLYGKILPNQDGAPIRIVIPWKYGFKSIKSIVKMRFVGEQPEATWNLAAPREYGFYSNVNPDVDHPRWSQSTERRIGELAKRKTLMFNGYADQVASLYSGMDLRKDF